MEKNRIEIPDNTIIRGRYKILKKIGQGGVGTTYKALDSLNSKESVLKVLDMEKLDNLKELELFEREVNVLKNLDYPGIPEYIEDFQTEISGHALYILVQEFIDGENLYKLVKNGKSYSEKEIISFIKSCLGILHYIHNLNPPVIHRDINPKNIILNKNNNIVLVDFGAVGRGYKDTITGAKSDTFVGTLGYMPQEQLFGKVHPGLDIYALGVTALFLISGKEPWEFPVKNMKIDFYNDVNVTEDLRYLLDKMINPDDKKRLPNTEKTLSLITEIEGLTVEKPAKNPAAAATQDVETEWVKNALKKKNKAETRETEEKYKEDNRLYKKKQRERNRALKSREKAEKQPQRAEIIKHSDGTELYIKPYFLHCFFPGVIFEYIPVFFTTLVSGGIFLLIVILGAEDDLPFISGMEITDIIISPVTYLIILAYYIIYNVILVISDTKKDAGIHIRVSKDGYCAVYKKNPSNPIYIDKKENMKISVINESYSYPSSRGNKYDFWKGITIDIPPKEMELTRTGLTEIDAEEIERFISLYLL